MARRPNFTNKPMRLVGKRVLLWNIIILIALGIALFCNGAEATVKKVGGKAKIKFEELEKLDKIVKDAHNSKQQQPPPHNQHAEKVEKNDEEDDQDDHHNGKDVKHHNHLSLSLTKSSTKNQQNNKHHQHAVEKKETVEEEAEEDASHTVSTADKNEKNDADEQGGNGGSGTCGGRSGGNRRHCVDDVFSLHGEDGNARHRKDVLEDTALKRLNAIYAKQILSTSQAYKYEEFIKQAFGEAEIFSTPMVFILEPWKKGRSSIVPVLLGTEDESPETDEEQHEFNIHAYGPKRRVLDGLQLMRNQTYHDLQRFGKTALRHMRAIEMPHPLLRRLRIIESPDLVADNAQLDRGYPMDDVHRWFAERADAVVLVLESDRLDIGSTIGSVLNEMDHQHNSFFVLINVKGDEGVESTLKAYRRAIWNVAPYISSQEPPKIYLTSFENPSLPDECGHVYEGQEARFLHDLSVVLDERFKNRLNMVLEHALEIRSHSLLVDRFVDTYMTRKSVFGNNKALEKEIIGYPDKYSVFESVIRRWNVSAEDLPEPSEYKSFFGVFPITQFNTLVGSCSFYGGCPHDRLNYAIEYDLPELLEKYERKLPICLSEPAECTHLEDKFEVRYKAPKKK